MKKSQKYSNEPQDKWSDLLSRDENPGFLMNQIQEKIDNDLEQIRHLNPRNITKWLRVESFEKWNDIYELDLTWIGKPSELSQGNSEIFQRVVMELWHDNIINTMPMITFFLKSGSPVRISLDIKHVGETLIWNLDPDGTIEFDSQENNFCKLLKDVQQGQQTHT